MKLKHSHKAIPAMVLAITTSMTALPTYAGFSDNVAKALTPACSAAKIPEDACKGIIVQLIHTAETAFRAPGKVLPKNGSWEMPLYFNPGQKSRVSSNFGPLQGGYRHRVRFDFINVRSDDLPIVRATVLADKPMRNDQPRSPAFAHGETVEVLGGGKHDRGFYIARIEYPGGREAFFLRNPNAKVMIRPVQSWKK